MKSKTTIYHTSRAPLPPQPNSNDIKFMSEDEISKRAKEDVGNPPINPKDFYKFKRVVSK